MLVSGLQLEAICSEEVLYRLCVLLFYGVILQADVERLLRFQLVACHLFVGPIHALVRCLRQLGMVLGY